MEIYLTSDLHFGHRNIINFCRRPWPDVDTMNRMLIRNWNEVVSEDDMVYILGDFAMGQIKDTLPLAGALNGRKVLVPGNHDRCWAGHGPEKARTWREIYERNGLEVTNELLSIYHRGQEYLLCHFPYEGDSHDEDRYEDWRPVDRGLPLLHGHVHAAWRRSGNMVNVGTDVWGQAPVHIDQAVAEFS